MQLLFGMHVQGTAKESLENEDFIQEKKVNAYFISETSNMQILTQKRNSLTKICFNDFAVISVILNCNPIVMY